MGDVCDFVDLEREGREKWKVTWDLGIEKNECKVLNGKTSQYCHSYHATNISTLRAICQSFIAYER